MIATPTYVIPPGPHVLPFEPAYRAPRAFEFADFNGDGYQDIIVAPNFSQHLPPLPIAIWLNRGDGTFYDGTAEMIEGAPPMTWNVQQIMIGDFNNDGRPDVLATSTGGEPAVADGDLVSGFNNTLLLSQPNGKYRDATAQIASNLPAYNHQSGLADANGDGNLDVAVNAYGTTLDKRHGSKLLYGDGKGNFSDATSALPSEIRFRQPGGAFQDTGCATLADLDGDGKAEVITGTYAWPDVAPGGTYAGRTVRFHKIGVDGKFVERGRVSIPDAIANIDFGNVPPTFIFTGLGCSQILAGDFNGHGRIDLLVQWEGNGQWYAELLRNDGNFQFTDITVEAFGSYQMGFDNNGGRSGPGHYRLMDINGDGTLDIVNQLGSTFIGPMQTHLAYLNDGTGHFTPWVPQGASGALTPADFLSASKCSTCQYLPLVFDTNKSGVASLVLFDFESSVSSATPSQTTAIYLTTFAPTTTALGVPSILTATAGDGSASIAFKAYDGGTAATGFTATCTGGPTPPTGSATASPIVVTGMSNGTSYSCSVKANNSSGSSIASAAVAVTSNTLNLVPGWNLLGNSVNAPLDVTTTLADASKVTSVWKWVSTGAGKWAFYSPTMAGQALSDYAASKGYDLLTTINGGEGFWVNANTAFTAQLPAGAAVTSTSFQNMSAGWHLIATGDTQTPSGFNTNMSVTPPAAGVVPQNMTSLWTWDNAQSKWYFYAPSLEAQGGTALSDYSTSHGYLDFGANSKTLGSGVGFWVNKPAP